MTRIHRWANLIPTLANARKTDLCSDRFNNLLWRQKTSQDLIAHSVAEGDTLRILMERACLNSIAPDFTLVAHDSASVNLRNLNARGSVVLVFIRGHWCPYCRRYLGKLKLARQSFGDCGASVLVISPEPANTSQAMVQSLQLPFPILSDHTLSVIDAYGVRNRITSSVARLPHPAVFIIRVDGTIAFRSIDRDYRRRTTMRTIHNVLLEIDPNVIAAKAQPCGS